MRTCTVLLVTCLCVLFWTGCSGGAATLDQEVTITGQVSARGNAPFSALMLETSDRVYYVLTGPDELLNTLQAQAPVTVRAEGTVYGDTWNGEPFAHLRLRTWEATR